MREIDSDYLIDNKLVELTRNILQKDDFFDIYLHLKGGSIEVFGGQDYKQQINSLTFDQLDKEFLFTILSDLDQKLDIDFRFVSQRQHSDLSIFYDTEIVTGDTNNVLGLATFNSIENKDWWEIFINRPQFNSNEIDYLRYALIHEIGHTLGLEHPFEIGDGDVFEDQTSPWLSSYPEETVMSYRTPINSLWPNKFSDNDLNALLEIWNPEVNKQSKSIIYTHNSSDQISNVMYNWFDLDEKETSQSKNVIDSRLLDVSTPTWGEKIKLNRVANASKFGDFMQAKQIIFNQPFRSGSLLSGGIGEDTLRGLAGWDLLYGEASNDFIHGGNGRDIISGGDGEDELHGDFGWNTFESENDGYRDLIVIKSDQFLPNWQVYGKAGNNLNGEKADVILGLDKFDSIKIVGVSENSLSFKDSSEIHGVTGIGIYVEGYLEAIYVGGNLTVNEISNMTTSSLSPRWSFLNSELFPPDLI